MAKPGLQQDERMIQAARILARGAVRLAMARLREEGPGD